MANKTFKRGSAVYTCRCCKRSTRDIHGEGGIKLCYQCYELAGLENELNDYGVSEDLIQSANNYFHQLREKGVDDLTIADAFGALWELAIHLETPTPVEDAPKAKNTKYTYPEGLTPAQKKKFRAAARKAKES